VVVVVVVLWRATAVMDWGSVFGGGERRREWPRWRGGLPATAKTNGKILKIMLPQS
jgi:hypothetical protein